MNHFNSLALEQGHKGQTRADEGSIQKATNKRNGGREGTEESEKAERVTGAW